MFIYLMLIKIIFIECWYWKICLCRQLVMQSLHIQNQTSYLCYIKQLLIKRVETIGIGRMSDFAHPRMRMRICLFKIYFFVICHKIYCKFVLNAEPPRMRISDPSLIYIYVRVYLGVRYTFAHIFHINISKLHLARR